MKKNFILISLLLLIRCGEAPADINSLIKSGNLNDLQNLKIKKQKELNQIKQDIDKLDNAIQSQDTEKKLLLGTDMIIVPQEFKHYITFQGTVDTDQNLVIYPEIPALLQSIYVQEGQNVKKGTPLVKLSDGGLQDQLDQMNLQLALAKTTFERQQILWDQKIGSEIQYLQAKTNYNTLEKSVSQMKDQVAKTLIKAPFDGIVDHIIADKGANLAPGVTPILRFVSWIKCM